MSERCCRMLFRLDLPAYVQCRRPADVAYRKQRARFPLCERHDSDVIRRHAETYEIKRLAP